MQQTTIPSKRTRRTGSRAHNIPEWTLTLLTVAELVENPKHPRTYRKEPVSGRSVNDDLLASIQTFGMAHPLVINSDRTIIDGERRLAILMELGYTHAPCFTPSRDLTERECEELTIRLNKNGSSAWDFGILMNDYELPDLLEWGFDMKELGMNVGDLAVDGKLFDERIAEGVELMATYRLLVPFADVEKFEPKVRALLKTFPSVQLEQSL